VKTAQRITERPNPTPGSRILAPICGRLGQRPNRHRTVFEVKKETSVDSCFPLTTQGSILFSREQWLADRKKLLAHEKELTKHYDSISAEQFGGRSVL